MIPIRIHPTPSAPLPSRWPFYWLRDPHGQSAVEITLLLPILLILLFGVIMSGFTFYAFIQVSNAAREGARAGSVYRLTQAETGWSLEQTVEKAVYTSSTNHALGFLSTTSPSFNVTSDVVVWEFLKPDGTAADPSDPRPGDRLTVQVTYRYTLPLISDLIPQFPQPITIVRRVMMEIQ